MTSFARSVVRTALCASVLAGALLSARDASADAGPKIDKGLFLPVGVNLGYSLNGAKPGTNAANGFLFGGEASLAFWKTFVWTGMYADVLHDFGENETRTSIGLEAGVGPVGVDFGYLGAFRDETAHGIRIRGILTASAVSLYGAYARTWTDARTHGEIGVLLKLPLPLFIEPVKRPEPLRSVPPEKPMPLATPPAAAEPPPSSPPTAPAPTDAAPTEPTPAPSSTPQGAPPPPPPAPAP